MRFNCGKSVKCWCGVICLDMTITGYAVRGCSNGKFSIFKVIQVVFDGN
jgi:hypothetical protein